MDAIWIILTGALAATSCSLLGCYLILRRMAMVGDAVSHAVLPGIVIAYLIAGSQDSPFILLGAGIFGILTTFLIEFFHRQAKVQADAAIGVTFTWLFAIGIILITVFARQVDLDQDCVLYGEIAYVPLDLWITKSGYNLGPRTIWTLGAVTLLIIAFIITFYKELFLTTFDPGFAAAIGISTSLWYYLLMGAVSFTTVAAFDSVGAILVVALFVAPPATAYLLTDNFKLMLWLSVFIGILCSIGGYYLAVWLNGSIAGAMSVIAGIFFGLALLFSPTHGLIRKRKVFDPAPELPAEKSNRLV